MKGLFDKRKKNLSMSEIKKKIEDIKEEILNNLHSLRNEIPVIPRFDNNCKRIDLIARDCLREFNPEDSNSKTYKVFMQKENESIFKFNAILNPILYAGLLNDKLQLVKMYIDQNSSKEVYNYFVEADPLYKKFKSSLSISINAYKMPNRTGKGKLNPKKIAELKLFLEKDYDSGAASVQFNISESSIRHKKELQKKKLKQSSS